LNQTNNETKNTDHQQQSVELSSTPYKVGFTLVQKIALVMLILIIIMTVSLSFTLLRTQQAELLGTEIVEQRLPNTFRALNFSEDLVQTYNALSLYLLTDDKQHKQQLLASMVNIEVELLGIRSQIENSPLKGTDEAGVTKLDKQWTVIKNLINKTISTHDDASRNFLVIRLAVEKLNPLVLEFNGMANIMVDEVSEAQISAANQKYLREILQVRYNWLQMINSLRLYFATHAANDLKNVNLYKAQVEEGVVKLNSLDQDVLFDEPRELQTIFTNYLKSLSIVLNLAMQGKWRQDVIYLENDINQAIIKIKNSVSALANNNMVLSNDAGSEIRHNLEITRQMNMGLLVSGIVVSLFITVLFSRAIKRRLSSLTSVAMQVSNGDFAARARLEGNDEITNLARSLNTMTDKLQGSLQDKSLLADQLEIWARELEAQKHALDEHAIVSIADVKGNISYVNDKFCKISGYSKEELFKQNHRIVNSGQHTKEFWQEMWRTIASGKTWHGHICNKAKDGTLYWVESTMVPFLNDKGKPYQYVSIRTDVTGQMLMANKLKKSNEQLESRVAQRTQELEQSKAVIEEDANTLRVLVEGTAALTGGVFFEAVVEKLCALLNVSYAFVAERQADEPDTGRIKTLWANDQLAQPFDYPLAGTPCKDVYDQGTCYVCENVTDKYPDDDLLKEMGIQSYIGVPIYNDEADVIGHLGIMHDQPVKIAEEKALDIMYIFAGRAGAELSRQNATAEMIESEKKFKGIFDSALDGMILIDIDTKKIVSANNSFCTMCGVGEEYLITQELMTLFPEWSREDMQARYHQALQNQFTIEQNIPLQHEDGSITYTDVNASQIELNGQHFMLAMFRDITERRKVQEELKHAYQYKSDFLSNMTHELRTPLNSIIGFSKTMLKGIDGPVTDDQQESLSHIARSGKHLLDLITDILDISKLESGRMELHYSDDDIIKQIQDAVKTLKVLAKEKGLQLKMDSHCDTTIVSADHQRIHQVLLNLLSNAVKFTDEGSVSVSCCMLAGTDPQLPLSVREVFNSNAEYLLVSVSDTGIGINKDEEHKVFEEFRQLDKSSTRRHGGTGLGMTISRRMVEMHAGHIWFESEFGKGTVFSFAIPVNKPQKATTPEKPTSEKTMIADGVS